MICLFFGCSLGVKRMLEKMSLPGLHFFIFWTSRGFQKELVIAVRRQQLQKKFFLKKIGFRHTHVRYALLVHIGDSARRTCWICTGSSSNLNETDFS